MTDTPLIRAARALQDSVRAVLEAVRVPTAPMFHAADHAYANRADATNKVVLFDEDYVTIFTAMIDAALSE